ncbi:hypothetical protein MUP77_15525 [Candidatus Bathyarchaeota archaeon]|nr:hypothetical protein [Candidatus Bathyarchaeota archaeon]
MYQNKFEETEEEEQRYQIRVSGTSQKTVLAIQLKIEELFSSEFLTGKSLPQRSKSETNRFFGFIDLIAKRGEDGADSQ